MLDLLTDGDLEVTGRLVRASNGTFFGTVSAAGDAVECVYKPVRGERPLWDFPDGTLAARERAAYLVSEAADWHVVPPTVLRDGPFGFGMVQRWVDVDVSKPQVDVAPAAESSRAGWFAVLDAYDAEDRPVQLLHRASASLRAMALFDAVVNNADRKGSHILPEKGQPADGPVVGCDHGLTFHSELKLRTVLWGWSGESLESDERARLTTLLDDIVRGPLRSALDPLLTPTEILALAERIDDLLAEGVMPEPGDRWPTIPWPPL